MEWNGKSITVRIAIVFSLFFGTNAALLSRQIAPVNSDVVRFIVL